MDMSLNYWVQNNGFRLGRIVREVGPKMFVLIENGEVL